MPPKPQIQIIQALRGFAALLVCFLHMKGAIKTGELPNVLFGNGAVGVPLFFIISGFIMYTTTQKLLPNWRPIVAFIAKRLLRIVPLYFVCTLLYLAVYSKLNLYVFEHPTWLLPSLFFYPTYGSLTGPAYGFPALAVGWSLNYEIYFYLLIAVCAFAGRWRWVVLISILLASVFIVPLITNGYVMQSLRQWYTYQFSYCSLMTNPILIFFVSGIALGKFYHLQNVPSNARLVNVLVFLSCTNFALSYLGIIPLFHAYWHHFFNCTFLIFTLLWRNKINAYAVPQVFVFLGDCSFSIYLIHPIVIGILPTFYRTLGMQLNVEGWFYFSQLLFVIIAVSALCYLCIEKPMNKRSALLFARNAEKFKQ